MTLPSATPITPDLTSAPASPRSPHSSQLRSTPMSVDVGSPAPDFTMPTDGGGEVSLSALRGKKVVLYFYPKDDTSGCTKQACGFRDTLPDFSGIDAVIIGVSKDSVASHDKFK